jgi:hypothetical protein
VRLAAGSAAPEVFDFLDEKGDVEYAVAMGNNSILLRRARKHMARARRLSKDTGRTEHVYAETRYATKTWPRKRRAIIKAEVTAHPGRDPNDDPRFVVTNAWSSTCRPRIPSWFPGGESRHASASHPPSEHNPDQNRTSDRTGVALRALRLVAVRPSVTLLPIPDEVGAGSQRLSSLASIARLDALGE